MRRIFIALLTLVLATSVFARDAAELQLALRKLTVTGGALYVAAHPDDENTAMLAWLANDRLVRTAYLSVTRGDGGQNLIGEETGAFMGLLRTQELLAARRIDGAEQMFTRAIDFGYSKNPEETLAIWGHDAVLADVVWAIRKFQPDVIVTRFPITGEGGHGHHTASAMLAEEAFTAAADPKRFPDQLHFVTPWQAKRIFWNRFSFGRQIEPDDPSVAKSLRVDLGTFNPLLGRAYTEIAAQSRSQHKSQGFGSAERRGSVINYYDLRFGDPISGDPTSADLFQGIDTSWARYPGGEQAGTLLQHASDAFDPKNPAASVPQLIKALNALWHLRTTPGWSAESKPWLAAKEQALLDAIRDCAGIAIDVAAGDSTVTPGAELPVSVTVVNRSDYPFRLAAVGSVYAKDNMAPGTPLENNNPVKTDLVLKASERQAYSQPYWLIEEPSKGMYTVKHPDEIGRPENRPDFMINVTLDDPQSNVLIFTVPVVYRWTDPVKGEQVRTVDVVPPVSVKLGSSVYLFPEAKARPVTIWMRSYGATGGQASLNVPKGWKAEPASVPITFSGKGDEARATFTVTPPAAEETATLQAKFSLVPEGFDVVDGIAEIDYPHIPAQRVLAPAVAKAVRANIKHRGEHVGYIMGAGDYVPETLRQVGYDVTLLSDDDLDRGEFSRFDAIVTGVRAYNTRPRLKLAQDKLMKYVENGGTMVVQYNTLSRDLAVAAPGPKPFKISRDRVTVEEAPVRLIDPTQPLLTTPNKITAADFDGWIQDRGLYFPNEWDSAYTTVLASNDPGEPERTGGELVMRHGKGVFVYTAYAWWRQLPAGVPGAIRAFVNLVSAK